MPRPAQFNVRKIKGRAKPWLLDIPANFSETGARMQKFFASRDEAKGFAEILRTKRQEHGAKQILLSPQTRREAVLSEELLAPFNVSVLAVTEGWIEAIGALGEFASHPTALLDAARFYAASLREKAVSVTFGALAEEFIGVKRRDSFSAAYLRQIKAVSGRMGEAFGSLLACQITPKALEEALRALKLTPASYNAYRRVLSAIFAHGERREYLSTNPVGKVQSARQSARDVSILANVQVRALLAAAPPAMVPYFAICCFAGLRPTECERLQWPDVDLGKLRIFIRAAHNQKESGGRFVPIEPNLAAWLTPHVQKTGHVTPQDNFRGLFEATRQEADKLLKASGNEELATLEASWVKDAMRHTAASNWSTIHEDVSKVSHWLGHDPKVHRKHYYRALPREDAEAYWKITPPGTKSKIIALKSKSA